MALAIALIYRLAYAQAVQPNTCQFAAQPSTSSIRLVCNASGKAGTFDHPIPADPPSTWLGDMAAADLAGLQAQAALVFPSAGTTVTPTAVQTVTPPPSFVTQFQTDYTLLLECEAAAQQIGSAISSDSVCGSQQAKVLSELQANESALLPFIQVVQP